jgi:hypothetical protein
MKVRPYAAVLLCTAGFAAVSACAPEPATNQPTTTTTTTTSTTTTSTTTTTTTTVPASTVDQSAGLYYPAGSFANMQCPNQLTRAQTFTARRTGVLDKVSLRFFDNADATNDVRADIAIRTVDAAGRPGATTLGSGAFAGAVDNAGGFTVVSLSSPAAVVAGTKYAIVISTSAVCNGAWRLSLDSMGFRSYGGGSYWTTTTTDLSRFIDGDRDLPFQTWVR